MGGLGRYLTNPYCWRREVQRHSAILTCHPAMISEVGAHEIAGTAPFRDVVDWLEDRSYGAFGLR